MRLNFRTIARQLHSDMVAVAQSALLANMDRGRPRHEQRMRFVMLEHHRKESEELLARHERVKTLYDQDLLKNQCGEANAVVVRLSTGPEYMCSGLASLDFDFDGQRLPMPEGISHLCFYTIAVPTGVAVVLSWRGKDAAAESLARSLVRLDQRSIPAAVMSYAFEYIDNIYLAPAWWEGLSSAAREALLARINRHVHPFYVRAHDAGHDDKLHATAAQVQHIDVVGAWN